ncbi:CBS domain-containing protein [Evansella sp. AB-P1]|uniref:CBS domain-containing protein n=1 Tax=Evansella sp. AB-P1 TaxID=3037653 RepID=UPI00241F3EE7|nr:CBS domain-containing protein [Evansella sp. AB-P1]MDG5786323.1 CBS domain-containing protein [Evansella sp. AB-P1]
MPKVKDVYKNITLTASIVRENFSIHEVRQKFSSTEPIKRCLYVVNSEDTLTGIITMHDLLETISVQKSLHKTTSSNKKLLYLSVSQDSIAKDIMRSPISVVTDDPLEEALQKMVNHNLDEIPVINDSRKVIGDLNAYEIITKL